MDLGSSTPQSTDRRDSPRGNRHSPSTLLRVSRANKKDAASRRNWSRGFAVRRPWRGVNSPISSLLLSGNQPSHCYAPLQKIDLSPPPYDAVVICKDTPMDEISGPKGNFTSARRHTTCVRTYQIPPPLDILTTGNACIIAAYVEQFTTGMLR